MPHQDPHRPTAAAPHHQALRAALDALLDDADFAAVRLRCTCTWTPRALACAAILWAWAGEPTLVERFATARVAVAAALRPAAPPAATYQAFLKLLLAHAATLAAAVAALRGRLREDLADRFAVAGFAAFAVDGTRLALPRTASNEAAYATPAAPRRRARPGRRRPRQSAAARRKKALGPRMWPTAMVHLGTGLPRDWRTGPDGSSERAHLREMLDALPGGALVVADAGLVGYDTWAAALGSGRHLLVRVGANVRLLRGLGYARERDGTVYLWPDAQAARGRPPLVPRPVVLAGPRHPVYLVTSVPDAAGLPDERAAELYRLRWGAELLFRHLKQTLGRRTLRSHRAENAAAEATWSLLGLWAACQHGQAELARDGVPARAVSVAGLLRAYRTALRRPEATPGRGGSLGERIAAAVVDAYRRGPRSSRDYPRKKREPPLGAPTITMASPAQVDSAERFKDDQQGRLTA